MMNQVVRQDNPYFLRTALNMRGGKMVDGEVQFLIGQKRSTLGPEERDNFDRATHLVPRHAMAHKIMAEYLNNLTTPIAKFKARIHGRTPN